MTFDPIEEDKLRDEREQTIRAHTRAALETAGNLVLSDRAKQYGPVEENFNLVGDYWTTYLCNLLRFYGVDTSTFSLTAHDVGIMMVFFKLARVSGPFKEDTYHDMLGYGALSYGIAKHGQEEQERYDNQASEADSQSWQNPSGHTEDGESSGPECGPLSSREPKPATELRGFADWFANPEQPRSPFPSFSPV